MSLEFISQVRILDPVVNSDRICDVIFENGYLKAMDEKLAIPEGATVLETHGAILGPGLVDLYSRSGEPGYEERETLEDLMKAAIAGGFTQINLLPNTMPALDNPGQVNWMRDKVMRLSHASHLSRHAESSHSTTSASPRVNFWGAVTIDVAGKQLCEFAELTPQVIGFADGQPIVNSLMLRRILEYLQTLGKPLMLWPVDPELTGKGRMRDGVNALKFGLPGIPGSAETVPLAMILELLREIPTPVHVMRISTARSVAMIASAKAEGLPITASVTWHHLLQDSTALKDYDPHLRLAVPLGNPEDRMALVQGIRSGVIDAIAVDHSAYTYEEKTVAFSEAPAGAIGYEFAFSALWQGLVTTGELGAMDLWQSLSQRPAHCLGQTLASMQPGSAQPLILFHPDQAWVVNGETLVGRSQTTHLLNQRLEGRVIGVWGNGQ